MTMVQIQKYPSPDEQNKTRILAECKGEINKLLQMSQDINEITPLIYEEEHVVVHLQRIEEFFDEL